MRTPSSSSSTATSKTPYCSNVANGIKKGPWTPEEDEILANFVQKEGEGRWRTLPTHAGLQRCGKSCRLRWMNYLRPSVKRGCIGLDEEDLILRLHRLLGNRWSLIAGRIPGRTDNEIKNYWNTHLSKKLIRQGIDPRTHKPLINSNPNSQKVDHESKTTLNLHSIPQTNSTPAPDIVSSSYQTNAAQSDGKLEHCQNMEGHSSIWNWPSCDNVIGLQSGVEVHHDKNSGEQDTFSSFLEALINDNVEVESQSLQVDNVFPPSPHPIKSSAQSLCLAFWEAEFRSAEDTSAGRG